MSTARKLRIASLIFGLFITYHVAAYLGIREKTWFEKFTDIFTGGGIGLVGGVVLFLAYGGFGIVSGTISFGVGLFGLEFVYK